MTTINHFSQLKFKEIPFFDVILFATIKVKRIQISINLGFHSS